MATRVPVLTYHAIDEERSVTSVSPARFRDHMMWLRDHGWRSLTLDQLLAGLEAGEWPDRSVVLTFDDGFVSVLDKARPVLTAAGLSAIVFAAAAHLGGTGASVGAPAALKSRRLLNKQGLRDAYGAGFEIGSHAMTHVPLTSLPLHAAMKEITRSREALEDAIGAPVRSFAYPFGDQSAPLIDRVRSVYDAGFSTRLAHVTPASGRASLERIDAFYFRDSATLDMLSVPHGRRWLTVRRWTRAIRG